jgi:hypothetical protein
MDRSNNWVFTLNNYTESNLDTLKNLGKYIIFGKEIGEKCTPHLQGYIEFEKRITLGKLKKTDKRIHWEKRRGSQKQAINYCKNPLSAVRDCLFNIFAATLNIWKTSPPSAT